MTPSAAPPSIVPPPTFVIRLAEALHLDVSEPTMETPLCPAGAVDAVRAMELHAVLQDLGADVGYDTCARAQTIGQAYSYYRAAVRGAPVARVGPEGVRLENPGR